MFRLRRDKRHVRVEGKGVCVQVERRQEICEGGGKGCVCPSGEETRDV